MKKALCVISGGMDSTLCAYIAKDMGYEIVGLHFDYNQRTMTKERECFEATCKTLNIKESLVLDASFIATIGANALTDKNIAVPKDEIDLDDFDSGEISKNSHAKLDENLGTKFDDKNSNVTSISGKYSTTKLPVTYVPFRNGIFLSIAAAVAEARGCEAIFIGVVQEDSSGYPDCSENFIKSIEKAINLGTGASFNPKIITPLVHLSKTEIVQKGLELGMKFEETWSCYEREDKACGHCDSCLLRLRGFKGAGVGDRIEYV
ncbi:MAG: 7-cyano-7-deazaguanine synthase QueC [Campylobacter sp.]|nr:7-cyano-7-deazaguanine synthase QueC [Campylobacter sp.]